MYGRMLDKQTAPTIAEMASYCGENGGLFLQFNEWLSASFATEQKIVFPYGNNYGWGVAHRRKNKLLCNVFAEDNAFTVMLRLSNEQWDALYGNVQKYMKEYIDNKYPCNDGGWIHYRVSCAEHIDDIKTALSFRCS